MKIHANAPLGPKGRATMVKRVLEEEIAVSVITAAELELGVLRAEKADARAVRLATLARVQATYPLLPVDPEVASCFARLASAELAPGPAPAPPRHLDPRDRPAPQRRRGHPGCRFFVLRGCGGDPSLK